MANDTIRLSTAALTAVNTNTGEGDDVVNLSSEDQRILQLSFTSSEVGNGSGLDANLLAPQDGGLAVRLTVPGVDLATSVTHRFDDEGIRFVAAPGLTLDVRDLVSKAQRGDIFRIAQLGTQGADTHDFSARIVSVYVNAGQGDDTITGSSRADFLVGGLGHDALTGAGGNDSFIGGAGNDVIFGGFGADNVTITLETDGSDQIDLGVGQDIVNVRTASGAPATYDLYFSGDEVGNGSARRGEDLAVQLAQNLGEGGAVMNLDDEGIRFVAGTGLTFAIRERDGSVVDAGFEMVQLGSAENDVYLDRPSALRSFVNAGAGNDRVVAGTHDDVVYGKTGLDSLSGGAGNDSLYGGLGEDLLFGDADRDLLAGSFGADQLYGGNGIDTLTGGAGADTMRGGGGSDLIFGGAGDDLVEYAVLGGADLLRLGEGMDRVVVDGLGMDPLRLTLGFDNIGDGLIQQGPDGVLSVQMSLEGDLGRINLLRSDDEGITFVGLAGTTFAVHDAALASADHGPDGMSFAEVTLGTLGDDELDARLGFGPVFLAGGQGNDSITGSHKSDQLLGGLGDDVFFSTIGADTIHGGAGNDTAVLDLVFGLDKQINLGEGRDSVQFVPVNGPFFFPMSARITEAEVGDGSAFESGQLANQDNGLALRIQGSEFGSPFPVVPSSLRVDDEGMRIGSGGAMFQLTEQSDGAILGTFRDLVFGSDGDDFLNEQFSEGPVYLNGGQGRDVLIGTEFSDRMVGGTGEDLFVTIGGADTILGGSGDDRTGLAFFNSTGSQIDLGGGMDFIDLLGAPPVQLRVTLTSSEVGNGLATEMGNLANQDGGLAVRLQAEDETGELIGGVVRVDDEGLILFAGLVNSIEVRDTVSGVSRGSAFSGIVLGTSADEILNGSVLPGGVYLNAGKGNDTIFAREGNDFLVGGAGEDEILAGFGADTLLGGGGDDRLNGGEGEDVFLFVQNDGDDRIIGYESVDRVDVSALDIIDITNEVIMNDTIYRITHEVDAQVFVKFLTFEGYIGFVNGLDPFTS